jgi:hypothetical protein
MIAPWLKTMDAIHAGEFSFDDYGIECSDRAPSCARKKRYGEPADWHTDPARDLGDRKVGLGYLTGPSVVRNAAGCVVERCPRHLLASAGFCGLGSATLCGLVALMAPYGGRSGLPKLCACAFAAAAREPAAVAPKRPRRDMGFIGVSTGCDQRKFGHLIRA